jgi:hypothetical protein
MMSCRCRKGLVCSHPEGRRGVGAGGFSLGVPETLAGGEKGQMNCNYSRTTRNLIASLK